MSVRSNFIVPAPAARVPPGLYGEVSTWLLAHDVDAPEMLRWSTKELNPPATAEDMAGEIVWIILCAGRSAQAARTIEHKVWDAIHAARPVVEAFGYHAKAVAIERAWYGRVDLFAELQAVLALADAEKLVEWCGNLSYVGDDTKFQLAKNFGADVCKPDIWLCRLTGFPDKPRRRIELRFPACMALCRHLAERSGDSIATVDSMLWLACNKGVLVVDEHAGAVVFQPKVLTARSIYEPAPETSELPLIGGSAT